MKLPEYELVKDGWLFGDVFLRYDQMSQEQLQVIYQSMKYRADWFEAELRKTESKLVAWRLLAAMLGFIIAMIAFARFTNYGAGWTF